MSIGPNGRLAISIAFLVLLIPSLALLARASKSANQLPARDGRSAVRTRPLAPAGSGVPRPVQGAESREMDNQIPKHVPLSVHLSAEKEKAAKDLKNEKWVRDFELEVKNTGTKPIYYLRLILVPELGKEPREPTPGLTFYYGREDLVDYDAPLTPEDIPIKPGEKVFLNIRTEEMDGWDHFRQAQNWPEKWSKPKTVTLYLEIVSFGDGTGFEGGGGEPHERKKPQQARRQVL